MKDHGKIPVREGKLDEAVEYFQELLKINKDSAEAYFYPGLVYPKKNEESDGEESGDNEHDAGQEDDNKPAYITEGQKGYVSIDDEEEDF